MKEVKFTKRQLDILRILREQTFSEKKLHKIYQGALMAMNYHENPGSFSQAAHSLRELNNIMLRHISLVTRGNSKGNQKEKMKILLKQLDDLGGIGQRAIIKQWDDLYDYFVKICHHGVDDIKNEDFKQKLEVFENIIYAILGPVYDSIKELDSLIEVENPSNEDIDMAMSFIKNLSQHEYFFKHLNLTYNNYLKLCSAVAIIAY